METTNDAMPSVVAPRPLRRAKTQALEYIREYTQRQAQAQTVVEVTGAADATDAPRYDEYGLLDTDSEDSDFELSDSESSSESTIDDEDMEDETED